MIKPDFDGSEYVIELDCNRLNRQIDVIRELMLDGRWRTLKEIEDVTGYPQASISADLRSLRKKRFGSYIVDKRRRGDEKRGLFEYKVKVSANETGQLYLL